MAAKNKFEVGFVFGAKKASTFDNTVKGIVKGIAGIASAYVGINTLKGAIDTFATFEQSMANVKAISGATTEEFQALEAAAMEMGRKTSKTAAESADALGYMALAGWDTQQSIKGLEPILRSSEAFSMDLATASDLVTDSMSAMGIAVDDLGGYLDVVAKAQNSANANGQQMMEAYLNVGGKLKDMNANMDESAAILGIMANRGIKGSEAGNSLNTILMRMTASTGESSKAMKALGISAFDAQGNWRSMEDIFMDVQQAISGLDEQQQAYYKDMIAGKNHSATFSAIMDGLGNEYSDLKDKIIDCDGALLDTAETMNNTMQGAFKRLESATDDMKIQFVKTFEKGLSGAINKAAEYIPVVTEKITQGIQWIGTKAAPVFTSIKDNAVASVQYIKAKWDQYGPGIIAFFTETKDRAVAAFTWVRDTGQQAIENIRAKFVEIKPNIQAFAGAVTDLGGKIVEKIRGGFELAKPVITFIATEALPQVVSALGAVFGGAAKVYDFFASNWDYISPLVYGIVGAFAAYKAITLGIVVAEKAKNAVMLISKGITTTMKVAQAGLNAVMAANPVALVVLAIGALIAIGVLLYKNWDKIKAKAAEVWQGMKDAFGGAVAWFRGVWDGVIATVQNFMAGLQERFPMIADIISVPINAVKGYIEGLKQTFTGIIDFVAGVFTGDWTRAWEGVKGIFGGIFQSFSSLAKTPINAVIAIINGAIRGINGISVDVPDWVPGLGGKTYGFAIPEIPMLAKGGIATAPTVAMVGEGNESEAILPLSKLSGMLNAPMNGIASLIERFLAAIEGGGDGMPPIQFSPQLVFNGPANQEDVDRALDLSFEKFKKLMAQYEQDRKRKSLK